MNKKTKLKTFVWDMVLIDLNNWTARRAATCPAVTFSGIAKNKLPAPNGKEYSEVLNCHTAFGCSFHMARGVDRDQ